MSRLERFESRFGELLYQLLPAVYRERDNTVRDARGQPTRLGDLALYLDAMGGLLDRVRATLDQRLADSFPDNPASGAACQDWLIPYFARLLDVRLVSPDPQGQRDEVAHAVRWRQSKGTLVCAEEIAESVTHSEVELQEGFRRVARTPRVGVALLPASVYGVTRPVPEVTRHPGLPVATVDFRCTSRAVRTATDNAATKVSWLGGHPVRFMQANPHGVPEAPSSFDDASRRTVDLRTPSAQSGHAHPRRLLAYASVPFAALPPPRTQLTFDELAHSPLVSWSIDAEGRELRVRRVARQALQIIGDVVLPPVGVDTVVIEGLEFAGRLTLQQGLAGGPLRRLYLRAALATELEVRSQYYDPEQPVLEASDCLIGTLTVPDGYARLRRCTVRRAAVCGAVLAYDTIFSATLRASDGLPPDAGVLRNCRVPPEIAALLALEHPPIDLDQSCTTAEPKFFTSAADDGLSALDSDAGVLRPDCAAGVLFGASDGRELGVHHDGRAGAPVVLRAAQTLPADSQPGYVLRDLVFAQGLTIESGSGAGLVIERVALSQLAVAADARTGIDGAALPVLDARSSLLGQLTVRPGLARLEYCTVLGDTVVAAVQASDCIFNGRFAAGDEEGGLGAHDCLRYCRLPAAVFAAQATGGARAHLVRCSAERPVFFERDFARGLGGAPGLAVLHPATPLAISRGAEDGGELGAFHQQRYCASRDAVRDKLAEHLPVGVEPVLIPDIRLHHAPAAALPEPLSKPDE